MRPDLSILLPDYPPFLLSLSFLQLGLLNAIDRNSLTPCSPPFPFVFKFPP